MAWEWSSLLICRRAGRVRDDGEVMVCGLFSMKTIWRRVVGWLVNDELERIWKEAPVAKLRLLYP
jgi:hypothetical protein